jgi:hypothetical protein
MEAVLHTHAGRGARKQCRAVLYLRPPHALPHASIAALRWLRKRNGKISRDGIEIWLRIALRGPALRVG